MRFIFDRIVYSDKHNINASKYRHYYQAEYPLVNLAKQNHTMADKVQSIVSLGSCSPTSTSSASPQSSFDAGSTPAAATLVSPPSGIKLSSSPPLPGNGISTFSDSFVSSEEREPDDDLLRRILANKRVSDGNIRLAAFHRGFNSLAAEHRGRKNSLIPSGDSETTTMLPPVKEGVMMTNAVVDQTSGQNNQSSREILKLVTPAKQQQQQQMHLQEHLGDFIDQSQSSLRTIALQRATNLRRRNSIATNTDYRVSSSGSSGSNSSSQAGSTNQISSNSSMSLSEAGSGTRQRSRCSSIISQCSVTSSVLSESARQQLNFSLSPDLPLDCSDLYETNGLDRPMSRMLRRYSQQSSGSSNGRPHSPEPSSLCSDSTEDFIMTLANTHANSINMNSNSNMDGFEQCKNDQKLLRELQLKNIIVYSPDSALGRSTDTTDSSDKSNY